MKAKEQTAHTHTHTHMRIFVYIMSLYLPGSAIKLDTAFIQDDHGTENTVAA